jgi:class 3 adenylate cyclase
MGSRGAGSHAALAFARDLIAELATISRESGLALQARVGIHTGPVVGGVIGSTRLAYDYWGDTMNVASRLQGAAPPNGVALSEATYFQARAGEGFAPQTAVLKGIGEVQIYVGRLDG